MHWTLVDGSPRGKQSNTTVLLRALARGLESSGHPSTLYHLANRHHRDALPELFAQAERFLLGFPLYTDAMPGQVKEFIERLEDYQGRAQNPPVAFLVQSGFPEPGQSRAVERYLELLAKRLGSEYLGTIVKGGVEGIQAMPPFMTRGLMSKLQRLGGSLGQSGRLDPEALRELAGPDWFTGWRLPVLHLLNAAGTTPYWNRSLRHHGAFDRRLDRPYAPSTPATPVTPRPSLIR